MDMVEMKNVCRAIWWKIIEIEKAAIRSRQRQWD